MVELLNLVVQAQDLTKTQLFWMGLHLKMVIPVETKVRASTLHYISGTGVTIKKQCYF